MAMAVIAVLVVMLAWNMFKGQANSDGRVYTDARRIFAEADRDGNGVLSKLELKKFLKSNRTLRSAFVDQQKGGDTGKEYIDWEPLWKDLDANGDGEFDETEWVAFYVSMFKASASLARSLFKKADANGDGTLSKSELNAQLDKDKNGKMSEEEWVTFYCAQVAKKNR